MMIEAVVSHRKQSMAAAAHLAQPFFHILTNIITDEVGDNVRRMGGL